MAEEDQHKPVTFFGDLADLLAELGQYGHMEFWYKETDIGVPGSAGARRLKRILTRDNRDIARWGINGWRWDFLPDYITPNKNPKCHLLQGLYLLFPILFQKFRYMLT